MSKFIIEGGKPLEGEINVSGAKNAVLPILSATLLSPQTSVIENVPDIQDIDTLSEILTGMGVEITREGNQLTVKPADIKPSQIDEDLVGDMRASVLLISALLSRFGEAHIPPPGGCDIGDRSIRTHLNALRDLGAAIEYDGEAYHITLKQPESSEVALDEMSMTATENILILAAGLDQTTVIHLAAIEPEIHNLIDFLRSMGADINLEGGHTISINGQQNLTGGSVKIIPDRIEAGTWAVLSALQDGKIQVNNFPDGFLRIFLKKLSESGIKYQIEDDSFVITEMPELKAVDIKTAVHPGFPTDLQALFAILLTQAEGTGVIFETLYEERFNYSKELKKMKAKAEIINPHKLKIAGSTQLQGTEIKAHNLRAGAAMVLAGLIAEGKTEISDIHHIDRGYENIAEKLKKVGADINRTNEDR